MLLLKLRFLWLCLPLQVLLFLLVAALFCRACDLGPFTSWNVQLLGRVADTLNVAQQAERVFVMASVLGVDTVADELQ